MNKRYVFLVTEEQNKILGDKTEAMGFTKKVDYIRFMIFTELSFIKKINAIHKKVVEDSDV